MSESLIALAEIQDKLHAKWKPHAGQIPIGRALFYEKAKQIFACCGRNFGKSQLAAYCAWRYALENPGTGSYIFEPFTTQAREILWASQVLQGLGPTEYIEGVNNTEMRITFTNGSFIKVTGSDNYEAYRGIKPTGLVIFDELKDLRPEFLEAFEPNLAAYEPPALYLGTPPDHDNHFVEKMNYAKSASSWKYFEAPTSVNPYIGKNWLESKRLELLANNEEETWIREYLAKYVKGGKRHIFPQIKDTQAIPFAEIIPKDTNRWEVIIEFDPAASSTFGVLISCFHPYHKTYKLLDELYLTDKSEMTVANVWKRTLEKLESLYELGFREFRFGYDEAASWFRNESYSIDYGTAHFKVAECWLEPTQKAQHDKDTGVSLIRRAISTKALEYSDKCVKWLWEMENYIQDDKGKIPKVNDHLIDNTRYLLTRTGYTLDGVPIPKEADPFLAKRALRIEDEFKPDPFNEFDFSSTTGSIEEF